MDRRIRKTEEQILQGTLRLLQHEKMEELTVTEICNEANVSRSTFYLHYLEPKDIVEQLYNDVAVTLTNILDNYDLGSPDIRHSDFLNSIFEVLRTRSEEAQGTEYHPVSGCLCGWRGDALW